MSESERIADQLQRALEGDAWHGPALKEVLAGVTPEQGARRPLPQAHSIWEIVQHIGVWDAVVRRRIEGETVGELPADQDWPPVRETGAAAWKKALEDLERGYRQLQQAIAAYPDERLPEKVTGKDYSFYVMLHGVVQHVLYHAGQIALLRKGLNPG